MSSLQEFFPYTPNLNFGRKRGNQLEMNRMTSVNKTGLENNDQFIQIISRQSLTHEQIEEWKKVRDFEIKFDLLSEFYQFNNEVEVTQFLQKNKFLLSTLLEIPPHIYDFFGAPQELSLRVSYEPESKGFSELWVEIITTLSAQEAMSILDEFDEHWWLEKMNGVAGKLNIILKFV
jgi:hypothetical protein